jgi:hypothetical protein
MTDRPVAGAIPGRGTGGRGPAWRRAFALLPAMALALAGCGSTSSPTATVAPTATQAPTISATPAPTATTAPTATATPEPPLSLALPAERDPRSVRVEVSPEVPADGDGRIVVTVTNLSDERVTELVLRWPTALRDTLFLAPFEPSQQRIAQGGPPLYQDWTKWVDGPGESGEPAGTTSLGWGPLDPGATLTIPVLVTRRASGAVAFDLQVLAGEAILTGEDGAPAELRVAVE